MLFYYVLLYLAPALFVSVIVVPATWKRAGWGLLDFLVIPLPGAVWMFLLNEDLGEKSFSNLAELLLLAVGMAALLLIRGWLRPRMSRLISSVLFLVMSLAATVAVFFLVPFIPD